MATWEEILEDILVDKKISPELKERTKRLLEEWRHKVMPSPKVFATLVKDYKNYQPIVCARLLPDKSCSWLRSHATEMGLRKPRAGERVYCRRTERGADITLYKTCPGFKHPEHVKD